MVLVLVLSRLYIKFSSGSVVVMIVPKMQTHQRCLLEHGRAAPLLLGLHRRGRGGLGLGGPLDLLIGWLGVGGKASSVNQVLATAVIRLSIQPTCAVMG